MAAQENWDGCFFDRWMINLLMFLADKNYFFSMFKPSMATTLTLNSKRFFHIGVLKHQTKDAEREPGPRYREAPAPIALPAP